METVKENNYKYTPHHSRSAGYTGKPLDKETDLYYYGARYYNPEWGRWVSRDNFKGDKYISHSLNLYQYCYNNPLIAIDPDGNLVFGIQGQANIMAGIGGGGLTIGVVTDLKGNWGIALTGMAGFGLGFGAAAGGGLYFSSAPTIWDIEGTGMVYGGTIAFLKGGLNIEVGQLTDFQYSDEPNDFTIDVNYMIGGAIEAHAFVSATGIVPISKNQYKKISKIIKDKLKKGEKLEADDFRKILGEDKYAEMQESIKLLLDIASTKRDEIKNKKSKEEKTKDNDIEKK